MKDWAFEQHVRSYVENRIRTAAYYKWLNAGSPEGDGIQFWLEAEKELNQPVKMISVKPIGLPDYIPDFEMSDRIKEPYLRR